MRIAYAVDVHDRFRAVPEMLARIGDVDLLVIGGDITTGGSPDNAARAIEGWRGLVPRLLAVSGNMDSPAIDARLDELGVALDSRGVAFGDVGVFGVSAAPVSPLLTPYELEEDELARRIERGWEAVADCRTTIFCPHAPPARTSCDRLRDGRHVGSEAVRAFIDRAQPTFALCGHIHEARGSDRVGRTQVVNPGPVASGHHAVIEIDDGTISLTVDGDRA